MTPPPLPRARPTSRRRAGALAAAGALVLVLAGCSNEELDPLPPPPTTQPPAPTTTAPDYSEVALPGVPGRTTTTIALTPGQATIDGTVTGPDGPVAGAVVHAERLVGDASAVADVLTNADGTFQFAGILGGRYRVRAFRPSDLALVRPEVFFLGGDEKKTLPLTVERFEGLAVTHAVAPNPPIVGQRTSLVVQVTQRSVDDKGIVRGAPVAGMGTEAFPTGRWSVEGSAVQRTDGEGRATFVVVCGEAGSQALSVVVDTGQSFPLDVAPCSEPVPEGEPAEGGTTTSTTARPGGTSTTRPGATSTTSTTRA